MSSDDNDDKTTAVLDLNALRKHRLNQDEYLENNLEDLEFNVGPVELKEIIPESSPVIRPQEAATGDIETRVIFFDFESDFFSKSQSQFPMGFEYHVINTLPELNKFLRFNQFQIIVFNYDVNAKAVVQLICQIKQKFPATKTMIMAKSISPEKAKIHASSPSGADGYYQLPLDAEKMKAEFLKINQKK